MTNLLFLDANSLGYAYQAAENSTALLDRYAAYAKSAGYELAVTDVVRDEILGDNVGKKDFVDWLFDKTKGNHVKIVNTDESLKLRDFLDKKDAGLPTGNYSKSNAGDRSIAESISKQQKAGGTARVFSDDGYFKNTQELRKFGLSDKIGMTTADMLNDAARTGVITPEEFAKFRDAYRSNVAPWKPNVNGKGSYSLKLDTFSTAEELSDVLSGKATVSSAYMPTLFKGLKVLGVAGLTYDIWTSTVEAADASTRGDRAGAGNIVARLAGRLYFGLKGGAIGAGYGAAIGASGGPVSLASAVVGGLVGGVMGAVGGDAAVDALWKAAEDTISLLHAGTPEAGVDTPLLQPSGKYYRGLIASGMPKEVADKLVRQMNAEYKERRLQQPNASVESLMESVIQDVRVNQAIEPEDEAGANVTVIRGAQYATTIINSDIGKIETINDIKTGKSVSSKLFDSQGRKASEIRLNPSGSSVEKFYDPVTGNVTVSVTRLADGGSLKQFFDSQGSIIGQQRHDGSNNLVFADVEKIRAAESEANSAVFKATKDRNHSGILEAMRQASTYRGLLDEFRLRVFEESIASAEADWQEVVGRAAAAKLGFELETVAKAEFERKRTRFAELKAEFKKEKTLLAEENARKKEEAAKQVAAQAEAEWKAAVGFNGEEKNKAVAQAKTEWNSVLKAAEKSEAGAKSVRTKNAALQLTNQARAASDAVVAAAKKTDAFVEAEAKYLAAERLAEQAKIELDAVIEATKPEAVAKAKAKYLAAHLEAVRAKGDKAVMDAKNRVAEQAKTEWFAIEKATQKPDAVVKAEEKYQAAQDRARKADNERQRALNNAKDSDAETKVQEKFKVANQLLAQAGDEWNAAVTAGKGSEVAARALERYRAAAEAKRQASADVEAARQAAYQARTESNSAKIIAVEAGMKLEAAVKAEADRQAAAQTPTNTAAKAEAERQAATKAEAGRQAAAKAEAERQAAAKAEAERQAAAKAEAERQAATKAEAGRQAAAKAEAERQAAAKADAERQAAAKAEAERQAAAKAEAGRQAAAKAERQAAAKADAERQAAAKAEAERQAAAKAEAERQAAAERIEAERRAAAERAERDRQAFEEARKAQEQQLQRHNERLRQEEQSRREQAERQRQWRLQQEREAEQRRQQAAADQARREAERERLTREAEQNLFENMRKQGAFSNLPSSPTIFRPPGRLEINVPYNPKVGITGNERWYYGGSRIRPVAFDLNDDARLEILPLSAVDRNSSGLEIVADGSTAHFDSDGNGILDNTAWIGPNDGILAIDLGESAASGPDGKISRPEEIAFSLWKSEEERVAELKAQGIDDTGRAVTDLEGLRFAFDTNRDNRLDSRDSRWGEFRIWQDFNQNGITDTGELSTLEAEGIAYLDLLPSEQGAQAFPDGSMITGTSSAKRIDGTSILVGDVALAYRPAS
ncbi:hypothetical protein [Agrobacterium tumefaciens]|uniref:hypothetical protein n=1 Tax=Agrobacterium tumefaciens TaxID=358 RepID=UPI000200B60E|nr:hypothetical protein [Agrobacterium tumefaciens]ADY66056.1 hypothetical protein AGROH133_10032 [Agrobacterium tumefaciens]